MKEWLVSNTGLKVIALILAVIVWFYVKAVTSGSRRIDEVSVEFKTSSGLSVTRYSPKTVSVIIRGTKEDILQVSKSELFAELDLQGNDHPGKFSVPLGKPEVRHPRRVAIISVEPTNLVVFLEKTPEPAPPH